MRPPPADYGDNFPVPAGSWDPAVPWRFPKHAIELKQLSLLQRALPWLMLGLGVALGILLMGWRFGLPTANAAAAPAAVKGLESAQQLLPSWEFSPRQPMSGVPKRHPKHTRSEPA